MKNWSWRSFAVGAATAAVLVGGVGIGVAVKQSADAQAQEAFLTCMGQQGYFPADPTLTDDDLDSMLAAGAKCGHY
jgi:hypothetical protein